MNDATAPVAARIDAAELQTDANLHVQVGAPVKRFHLWVQGPAWLLCFTIVALGFYMVVSGYDSGGGWFAVWLIRSIGLRFGRSAARSLLYPITLYFYFRRGAERRASYRFLERALGRRAARFHRTADARPTRRGEGRHIGRMWVAHFRRPLAPRKFAPLLTELLVQRLEGRERGERRPALLLELAEGFSQQCAGAAASTQVAFLKAAVQRFQGGALQCRHRSVVDKFSGTCRANCGRHSNGARQGTAGWIPAQSDSGCIDCDDGEVGRQERGQDQKRNAAFVHHGSPREPGQQFGKMQ